MTLKPTQDLSELPFAPKKYREVHGHTMAYIDEGEGIPIIFQHGNPTSSYLWRNVMRECQGLGRLIAADVMGLGDSEKLDPALGNDRYGFDEQRKYLHGLWESLDLGDEVILVLHDCGSMFGFDWARQNAKRVKGIAYMESIVRPLELEDFPEPQRTMLVDAFSSPLGLESWLWDVKPFLDDFLLSEREFTETEKAYHRKPLLVPGEDRRPVISFGLPVNGEPTHVAKIVTDYGDWMAQNDIPKLMVRAEPGYIMNGRLGAFAETWPNQTEITVKGYHFVQETAGKEIGEAVAKFIRGILNT